MNTQEIKKLTDGTILVNKKLKNATFKKMADGLYCFINSHLYSWNNVEKMADGFSTTENGRVINEMYL